MIDEETKFLIILLYKKRQGTNMELNPMIIEAMYRTLENLLSEDFFVTSYNNFENMFQITNKKETNQSNITPSRYLQLIEKDFQDHCPPINTIREVRSQVRRIFGPRNNENEHERIRNIIRNLALLTNKETEYEKLIKKMISNDDDTNEIIDDKDKQIYVLTKFHYLTSGKLDRTIFNNLISALDCYSRKRSTLSEWFRNFNFIHSGEELRKDNFELNQFIDLLEEIMNINEDDWKTRSFSEAPEVNSLKDEEY
jgi:hypothetical protein